MPNNKSWITLADGLDMTLHVDLIHSRKTGRYGAGQFVIEQLMAMDVTLGDLLMKLEDINTWETSSTNFIQHVIEEVIKKVKLICTHRYPSCNFNSIFHFVQAWSLGYSTDMVLIRNDSK